MNVKCQTLALAAALAMAVAGVAVAGDAWFSGPELREYIVGSTVSGVTPEGETWSETYGEDGSLIVETYDGMTLVGRWEIDDDLMCATYPEHRYMDNCWAMRLDGDEVTYITEHGVSPQTGTLTRSTAFDFMTSDEIGETIIGGTITGTTIDGATWSETYHADGTFEGMGVEGGVLTGRWELHDEFLCVLYDGDPVVSCWALQLDGDQVRYVSEHGSDGGHGTLTRN